MSELYQKYNVTKVDGSLVDPSAQYFVLRLDTDVHARKALRAYINSVRLEDPEFADQLHEWQPQLDLAVQPVVAVEDIDSCCPECGSSEWYTVQMCNYCLHSKRVDLTQVRIGQPVKAKPVLPKDIMLDEG